MVKKKKRKNDEEILQQQIVSYLSFYARKYNFLFFAPLPENAMSVMTRYKAPVKDKAIMKSHMSKMGFIQGVSDILIFHHRNAYCMELKTKTGTQQSEQVLFESNCKRTGIPYEVIRSLDEATNQMRLWGIIND